MKSTQSSQSRKNENTIILRIVEALKDHIASGVFVPGQRLIESELAVQFDARRGTIREALRFLAGDGVIELLPFRGAQVTVLTPGRIADMLEVTAALFRAGMELLAEKPLDPKSRSAIEASVKRLTNPTEFQTNWQIATNLINYHEVIIGLTHNAYLKEILGKIYLKNYTRQLSTYADHEYWEDSTKIYVISGKLMLEGDADGAYKVLLPSLRKMVAGLREAGQQETVVVAGRESA